MLIDVAKLRMQPGTSKEYKLVETWESIPWAGELLSFSSPVKVEAIATNTGKSILVRGKANTDISLRCGRCLQPVSYKTEIEFQEEFFPQIKNAVPSSKEDTVRYYLGDTIDLKDVILEGIFLEIPMKAVCSESCRGLCPKCGVNLNEQQCVCLTEEIDPRLAVLQKMLQQSSGKEV
ncbi:YceD family protein [Zhaonella formicivorans]|uniref:YceD family protein n=1 Tax=Zhaonella formicivorans TaxID=2528593 RepID=UPI0010D86C23|nr:DUF177 domain-containing protein [Zhaonella formicivorans]